MKPKAEVIVGRRSLYCQARKGCWRAGSGSGTGGTPVSFWRAQGLALAETHGRDARAAALQESELRPPSRRHLILHRLRCAAAINWNHVVGKTLAGRGRAAVWRGAIRLPVPRPDPCRAAAQGRRGRFHAAGRFRESVVQHPELSRRGVAADFIFPAAASNWLERGVRLARPEIETGFVHGR